MLRRVLCVAIAAFSAAISINLVSSSFAQTSQPNYDRLKKLLDEKFSPPPSDQKPSTVDKKDLHWIAPKPQQQQRPTPQPRRQGLSAPASKLMLADNRNSAPYFTRSDAIELPLLKALSAAGRQMQFAQAPVAKRNSYVIQLKPNATEQQIKGLLAKYGLQIMDLRGASYGVLRVERTVSGTSSAEVEKLSNVLNQQIITQLRREPIVATATVDTAMIKHSVPKSSNTTVEKDGLVYKWNWGAGISALPDATLASSAGLNKSVPAPQIDGNWGLKSIRMPVVWTILQRYRDAKPDLVPPKLAIIDTGFAKHEDLDINMLGSPNETAIVAVASTSGSCGNAHGNHVAGIAGATHGNGIGIDGVVPKAKIDAVPWSDTLVQGEDPGATSGETRTTFFSEAIFAIMSYVETSANTDLRVVNVSLGYNFGARPVTEGENPEKILGLKETIQAQAVIFASLAKKHENSILFVTAAGNDSNSGKAYEARWSSPIVWAATQLPPSRRPKNILIVEANDRNGQRADFSNIGGHVAAPGVDILSTLWPGDSPYGLCPGTSMASPHVAGLAVMLFELAPNKKPAEIAEIIKTSAIKPTIIPGGPPKPPGAPRLDALEAVIRLSPDNLVRLADLNRDGKVDIEDLKIFAKQFAAIEDNRKNGTAFTEDLNGDGVVDANECNWPLIDLNGSGTASLSLADAKMVQGQYRTDLDVLAMAWTDKTKDFKTALKEIGLDVVLQAAETAPMAVSSRGCR